MKSICIAAFWMLFSSFSYAQCCTEIYKNDSPNCSEVVEAIKETGAVFFMPESIYNDKVRDNEKYGRQCKSDENEYYQFVIPLSQLQSALRYVKSQDNPALALCALLGTEDWEGHIVYVIIPPYRFRGNDRIYVREPDDQDCGANRCFVPGCLTSGGMCEGYIPQQFSKYGCTNATRIQ